MVRALSLELIVLARGGSFFELVECALLLSFYFLHLLSQIVIEPFHVFKVSLEDCILSVDIVPVVQKSIKPFSFVLA